jgi:hypothetical protein
VKLIAFLTAVLLLILVLLTCATNRRPSGGPPDLTAPSIISIFPENGSTMIAPNTSFRIRFSKSMRQEATEGAIFLSPVFWDYPKIKWSGKELIITPPENLRENTTYILTIGAGVTDSHGNRLGKSQNFAFSTGAVIDSGSISGAVLPEEGQRTVYDIWAYRLADSTSLEFWKNIPDYATQVDSTGSFSIKSLTDGRYLVIAIDDKNDDLFWDPSSESIGLPPALVNLTAEENIVGMLLHPARRDTIIASVTKASPINQHRISIEFSTPVPESLILNPKSFEIVSVGSDSILSHGQLFFAENGKIMLETDPQIKGRLYRLKPLNLKTIWGNSFDTSGVRFEGSDNPDTAGPRVLSTYPPDGSTGVFQDSCVEMTFDERLNVIQFPNEVKVIVDSTDTLVFSPFWQTPNKVRLRFAQRLPREKSIEVWLNPRRIVDLYQNHMPDSAFSFHFRLPPVDTVGSILAEIENPPQAPVFGMLTDEKRGGEVYKGKFIGNKLNINAILPGLYHFEYFEDSDKNSEWSPGIIAPFESSEISAILPDTIRVRSRWTTDIGSVSLPDFNK